MKSVRWILSALALLPCTFVGAIGGGDDRWPAPRGAELEPARRQMLASLEASGGREVRVLRDLDFLPESAGSAADFPSIPELPLTPGACLTAVVVARTSYPVQASFRDERGAPLVVSDDAHVTALSICHLPSLPVARLHVQHGMLGNLHANDVVTGPQRIDVHVIEGDRSSPEALAAGRPTLTWGAALQPAALYAHHRARAANASSDEGAWLEVEVALEPFTVDLGTEPTRELTLEGGALLLPRSPSTEAWLREAARFGCPGCRGTPRVHPKSRRSDGAIDAAPLDVDPVDPEGVEPERVIADPLWHGPASFWRVIAVVDPGDLPPAPGVGDEVPCATIRLRRLGAGSARYARTTSLAEAPTFLDDGADRFCPGDPVRLYVAPRDDRAVHHVALQAEPTRGPRRTGAAPIVGEHPRLIDARARCEAEPRECLSLARWLHHGTYATPDPNGATIAFRRACEEAGVGCVELVAHLDAIEPRESLAWMQNHCRSGGVEPTTEPRRGVRDGAVCATLGDRHRLARGTRFDLRAAREAYVRGCELGDANACHDRDALDLLNL